MKSEIKNNVLILVFNPNIENGNLKFVTFFMFKCYLFWISSFVFHFSIKKKYILCFSFFIFPGKMKTKYNKVPVISFFNNDLKIFT